LADLSDYLAPSQACIKPLLNTKKEKQQQETKGKVEFDISRGDANDLRFPGLAAASSSSSSSSSSGGGGHFDQIRTDPKTKSATVTLQDCLACSGCVTSAETVLITAQSIEEFLAAVEGRERKDQVKSDDDTSMQIDDDTESSATAAPSPTSTPRRTVVVSISPASLTALAHTYSLSPAVCARKLNTFFTRHLGCALLADLTPALDLALVEAREEFVQRYRKAQGMNDEVDEDATQSMPSPAADDYPNTIAPSAASPLPILTSECPGWICYAEKTQGVDILSHVSSVKSPQAIFGSYLKQHWCPNHSPPIAPNILFHASIQPCYDKKLEGSRPDFYMREHETRETDCVLATDEVRKMIEDKGIDMTTLEETTLDTNFWNVSADQSYLYRSLDVGGSGGYAEYLFRYASDRLFNVQWPESEPLPYVTGRNADLRELRLEIGGKVVLQFGLAYGFRNIQNIMRKMKMKKGGSSRMAVNGAVSASASAAPSSSSTSGAVAPIIPIGSGSFHYIEVMACPSGCLNGGGQIKAVDIRSQKQLVVDLDRLYHEQRRVDYMNPQQNPLVQRIYDTWLQGAKPYSKRARQALHTHYHAVEQELINPLGIKW